MKSAYNEFLLFPKRFIFIGLLCTLAGLVRNIPLKKNNNNNKKKEGKSSINCISFDFSAIFSLFSSSIWVMIKLLLLLRLIYFLPGKKKLLFFFRLSFTWWSVKNEYVYVQQSIVRLYWLVSSEKKKQKEMPCEEKSTAKLLEEKSETKSKQGRKMSHQICTYFRREKRPKSLSKRAVPLRLWLIACDAIFSSIALAFSLFFQIRRRQKCIGNAKKYKKL